MQSDDTIYALSTPPGKSGLAIVRCSGPEALSIAHALTSRSLEPRRASLAALHTRVAKDPIDQAIVVPYPGPSSATGENLVEFQIHGSRAVVQALTSEIGSFSRTRPAEAGEFTRRAFENGKLDFTQIEGLVDLIEAETSAQRLQALAGLDGQLSRMINDWRAKLLEAYALYEACFDFADEAEIDDAIFERVTALLEDLQTSMADLLSRSMRGPIIRDGLKVAIVGPPNVGKSSLFNYLAGSNLAIVSPIAGTTRDVLSFTADIGGMSVTFFDTAGLRKTGDEVEAEGVSRAEQTARDAHLILSVTDSINTSPPLGRDLNQQQIKWIIRNKVDLPPSPDTSVEVDQTIYPISCVSGAGTSELLRDLEKFAETQVPDEPALMTRERHRVGLTEALNQVGTFLKTDHHPYDVRAEHLRQASKAFGQLTGLIDAEDLLDVIFSEYCIGK